MPTPTTTNPVSIVPAPLAQPDIDALISLVKWGGPLGSGVQLTYSFPWEGGAASWFAGYGGAAYSLVSENTAAQHFGLDAQQQAAFRSALQVWSNVANVVFAQVPDNATSAGDIRVGFSTAVPAGTWGWAYFPKGDWPNGGDIWISPQAAAGAGDWSAGSYNYLSLIHELGHALGLKHPFADGPVLPDAQDNLRDTVMSYTEPDNLLYVSVERDGSRYSLSAFNVQPTTPMVLDIAAIQYLYGANMTYRTGDDIYTFDRATPILQALWDAGGDDTISVANFSRGCEIDLRPGHYSVVYVASDAIPGVHWEDPPPVPTYDGSPNLGIAFGCDIENAIGGSGADLLTGNELDNRLDGGGGADTLHGGGGNDVFDWDAGKRLGSDTFYGGAGDDTFALDTATDRVVELRGEGNDTVWASVSYSLANQPDVENVRGLGTTGLRLEGNAADNVLSGTSANDTLSGGAGIDTVVFGGARGAYAFTATSSGFSARGEGIDTLASIERFVFADQALAWDLDGRAGTVARILGAVMGPGAAGNSTLAGIGLALADAGTAEGALVQLAIEARVGAGASHQAVVELLYFNVMGAQPNAATEGYLSSLLDSGAMNVADLGLMAVNHPQNSLNIGLTGLSQTGLAYLPH